MRKLIFSISLLLLWPNFLRSATYYVTKGGNDSNNGSIGTPWLTIQKAANTIVGGDTVIIGSGNYAERVTTPTNGSAGNKITFSSTTGATFVNGMTCSKSYIVIDGLNFTGTSIPLFEGVVMFTSSSSNCEVVNTTVENTPVNVYGIYCSSSSPPSNLSITKSVIRNTRSVGLLTYGTGHYIAYNYFSNIYGSDACVILSSNTTLYRNRFIGWSNPLLTSGTLEIGLTYSWISVSGSPDFSNVGAGAAPYTIGASFTATGTTPTSWGTASVENANHTDLIQSFSNNGEVSQNVVVDSNFALDCRSQNANITNFGNNGNISDWIFKNNIFVRTVEGFNVSAPNVTIYNNLFYECTQNSGLAIQFVDNSGANTGKADGAKCLNNIFYACGANPASASQGWYAIGATLANTEANYNLVIGTGAGTTKTGFQSGGREANGINGQNPLFVDASKLDFQLSASSPAVRTGTSLATIFAVDYAGILRAASWDVGPLCYLPTQQFPAVARTILLR